MKFSPSEAQEIAACLEFKLMDVESGRYRIPPSKDQTPECYAACLKEEDHHQMQWALDLKKLLKKIGIDGRNLHKRKKKSLHS